MTDLSSKIVNQFNGWATKAHNEIARIEQKPAAPATDIPATSAYGHLMNTVYEALLRKMGRDEIEQIKEIAISLGQSAAGTKAENPAEWLLLAFYAAVGPVDGPTRSKCKRLGLLLLYAQQQDVKSTRLLGRLYEDGGFARISKLMRVSNPDLFARRKRAKKRSKAESEKRHRERLAKREQRMKRELLKRDDPDE